MQPNPALPAFHSPELGPYIFRAPFLRRLDCPGHRTGGVRRWVTARRIKEYAISDERPSQFIFVVIFDINVQVRPATTQVDWLRAREYRLPGSTCRAFSIRFYGQKAVDRTAGTLTVASQTPAGRIGVRSARRVAAYRATLLLCSWSRMQRRI